MLLLVTLAAAQGQRFQDPKVALSFNALNFFVYTFDVEGYIPISKNNFITPGIGFGSTPVAYAANYGFVGYIPHQVTVSLGFTEKHHFLEVGYKGLVAFSPRTQGDERTYGSFLLTGYRHHGKKSHLLFKTYVAPGFQFYQGTHTFAYMLGLSLGGFF